MKNYRIKVFLAIFGVIFAISMFIRLCLFLAEKLRLSEIVFHSTPIPHWVIYWVGAVNVLTFVPIFIAGVWYLKPQGAVGKADHLVTRGIYKYLRNPFYAGISFSIFGVGVLFMQAGIVLAGLIWLAICFNQCKREEKELEQRFGQEYREYKKNTPMLIPDFQKMFYDFYSILHKRWSHSSH